jgi:hypothetical protein
MFIGSVEESIEPRHVLSYELNYPVNILSSKNIQKVSYSPLGKISYSSNSLENSFPKHFHLLSLDSLDADHFVFRIQHLYQNNEMNDKSFFKFEKLFKYLQIYPKNETSLSLMHFIQNSNLGEIELKPMDIRTFIISKNNISTVPLPIPSPKPSPIPSPKPTDPFPPQRNQTVNIIHPNMSLQIILSFILLFSIISMIVLLLIMLIFSMSKKTFSQTSSE